MLKKCMILLAVFAFIAAFGPSGRADAAEKKLKAAFALLWTIDDQGWTTAHYDGIKYLQEKMGDKIEVSYTEKVLAADAERVIRDYAKKGYDIIFGTTFEHMDPLLAVAGDYPNIKFEHCSGFKSAENMRNYFGRMYQAEYLAGYLAGLRGFHKVGTVATQPIPEVIRGINAFTIGLKKGLDEAGVKYDVDKLNTVVWLKAWRDATNETTLAETLIARKHDLIRQMADTPDSATAACAAGVPTIGYGEDVTKYGADCALISTTWNWGPFYEKAVQEVMDGTWNNTPYWGGIGDGGVKLSSFGKDVPEDIKAKVLAEEAGLKKNGDNIFAGPVVDQTGREVWKKGEKATDKDLLGMQFFVQGVSGKLPQ